MTDEQIEVLKAAALAATPQNIDSAQRIEHYDDGSHVECPACGGEGHVELEADFCNYDGTAIGVQFYGIGNAHGAAEAYFRAASPANVLALIERLDCAERALLESKPADAHTYHNDTPEHRAARQAVGIEPADSPIGDMIGDLQSEQTYISSDRDRCHPEYELPRWDRIQRVINYLAATHTAPAQPATPAHCKKGGVREIDGRKWVCTDPEIDRWVTTDASAVPQKYDACDPGNWRDGDDAMGNHTAAAPAQPCGEDAANVAMLLTAEQKSALSQAADVMGANGFYWVEDTLRDLIAGANGAIGEREHPAWEHELKTDPEVFAAVLDGSKTHEIRFNDRDFKIGDTLLLRETRYTGQEMRGPEPRPLEYTGRETTRVVSHVLEGYGLKPGWVILSFARAALPAEKVAQAEPVAWRTKEFVMSRLQEAAKEPPSKRSVGNADRLAGDIWRTVLLSDLQEIVRHAAAPQSTQSPDGRVIDKAMVKRLAVQHGLLSVQTQVALTDEQRDNFDVRIKSAAEKHALDRTADGGWIFENHNLFNFAYAVTVAHPASGGES